MKNDYKGDFTVDWIPIDLHMHTMTGITRDGNSDDVKFTYINFIKAIEDFDLKLMATTNHNLFDIPNFIALNYLCSQLNRKILPGIEIDSVLDDSITPLHMVIILKDDFKTNYHFSLFINKKTKDKSDNVVYGHEEIVKIVKDYDSIIIPHGDKAKGIFKNATEENIKEALKKVREGFIRIFDSPSNWKLEKIKTFLSEINESNLDDFGGVLFSDVRDWSRYKDSFRFFKMNANPSFKGLVHSTSNPTKRFAFETSINYNHNFISQIKFSSKNKNSRIQDTMILLNRGFNCVIGKSGSGKSLLIEILKNELIEINTKLSSYPFITNTNIDIYNENGIRLDPSKINVTLGANLYSKILSAHTKNDSSDIYGIIKLLSSNFVPRKKFNVEKEKMNKKIKEYCNTIDEYKIRKSKIEEMMSSYSSNIDEIRNLKRIKTFSIPLYQNLSYSYKEDDLTEFSKFTEVIDDLKEIVNLYKGKHKSEIDHKIEQLCKHITLANLEMEYINSKEDFENKKRQLLNSVIKQINAKISSQSERKSVLNKTIFDERNKLVKDFVDNYKVNIIIKNMDLSLQIKEFNDVTTINDKYKIKVFESINTDIILKFDIRENSIFNTHGKKLSLDSKLYNLTKAEDAKIVFNKYIELGLINKDTIPFKSDFDVSVKIEFNGQNISNLNPGDIAKTYISVYFEEEVNKSTNHVVLFDQIENDVDKEFISDTIKTLIENTKGKIQTIIVTHDPIIAVNADPNNYIEAIKNKDEISYRNFCAESDIQDELNNIAKNVDGSKDVIRKRYEIYEGERK